MAHRDEASTEQLSLLSLPEDVTRLLFRQLIASDFWPVPSPAENVGLAPSPSWKTAPT